MVEKIGVENIRVELSCNPFKECQSRGTTRGLSTRGPHEVALFPEKSLGGRTGPLRQRGNWKGQFCQDLKKSFWIVFHVKLGGGSRH